MGMARQQHRNVGERTLRGTVYMYAHVWRRLPFIPRCPAHYSHHPPFQTNSPVFPPKISKKFQKKQPRKAAPSKTRRQIHHCSPDHLHLQFFISNHIRLKFRDISSPVYPISIIPTLLGSQKHTQQFLKTCQQRKTNRKYKKTPIPRGRHNY